MNNFSSLRKEEKAVQVIAKLVGTECLKLPPAYRPTAYVVAALPYWDEGMKEYYYCIYYHRGPIKEDYQCQKIITRIRSYFEDTYLFCVYNTEEYFKIVDKLSSMPSMKYVLMMDIEYKQMRYDGQ
jgi:hypothetical protein